jgi:drug/metabolite transporter (DMT)-like permease
VTAIRLLPVSTALVIFYSFPVFSAFFSFLIYGERIGRYEIACTLGVLIGVGILFDFQLAGGLLGQAVALLGGIFAGLTVTLIRSLRENNGPVIIYLYLCTMGTLVTLPKFALHPVWPATPLEWVMILGIIFSSATAQLLMNQGFFYCRGWEGGVFMSSEVVFTAVVGIVFLGDPATWRFWAGGLMILASGIAMNRLRTNRRPAGEGGA